MDKLTLPLIIAAIMLTTVGFLLAFFWAGPVNGAHVNGAELIGGQMVSTKLLLSQKIFYFHMPAAIVSMLLVLLAGFHSIRSEDRHRPSPVTGRGSHFQPLCSRICAQRSGIPI